MEGGKEDCLERKKVSNEFQCNPLELMVRYIYFQNAKAELLLKK